MEEEKSITNRLSRRELLFQVGGVGLLGVLGRRRLFSLTPERPQPSAVSPVLSQEDDDFLQEMEKRNFQYFWEQASPQTGLIRDRCNVAKNDNSIVASIAATGFGLTGICIAQQRELHSIFRRAGPGLGHLAFSLEKDAHTSRLLLPFRRH